MKTISYFKNQRVPFLVLVILLSLKVQAYSNTDLAITFSQPGDYSVTLAGQSVRQRGNIIHLYNLPAGRHAIQIEKLRYSNYGSYGSTITVLQNFIDLPVRASVAMRFHMGHLNTTAITMHAPKICGGGWGIPTHYDQPSFGPGTCGTLPYPLYAMQDQDFQSMLQAIANRSFESTKIQMAHSVIAQNSFSTYQALELLSVFNFESSRLEIAKAIYARLVDPQNAYKLYDAFTFESSISEFEQYIYNRI
ncbi:MAG: hypothetical protein RIQ89_1141 [Bacteroidota bacterium]|jgi:hypothetical protein